MSKLYYIKTSANGDTKIRKYLSLLDIPLFQKLWYDILVRKFTRFLPLKRFSVKTVAVSAFLTNVGLEG